VRFDNWKIQHVYYPSVKKASISVGREYFCYMIVCAFLENQTVKHTVDQVAERACEYEAGTDDITIMIIFFNKGTYIINTKNHGSQPEKSKNIFPNCRRISSPGHASFSTKNNWNFGPIYEYRCRKETPVTGKKRPRYGSTAYAFLIQIFRAWSAIIISKNDKNDLSFFHNEPQR